MTAATIRQRREWLAGVEASQRLGQSVQARWPHDAPKFLDLDRWLDVNLARARELGLDETRNLKVLDLGSGTGQFLFVCSMMGHEAIGVDLPEAELESPEKEIFTVMPAAFSVHVIRTGIAAFQPVAVSGSFDLITSFMVCFNNHKRDDEWSQREWQFFVADMCSHLNPGGRLALRLNHNEERFGPRGYFDAQTGEFFRSLGTCDDGNILITI